MMQRIICQIITLNYLLHFHQTKMTSGVTPVYYSTESKQFVQPNYVKKDMKMYSEIPKNLSCLIKPGTFNSAKETLVRNRRGYKVSAKKETRKKLKRPKNKVRKTPLRKRKVSVHRKRKASKVKKKILSFTFAFPKWEQMGHLSISAKHYFKYYFVMRKDPKSKMLFSLRSLIFM